MAKKLIRYEKLQRQSEKLDKRFESRSEETSGEEAGPPRSALSEDGKNIVKDLVAESYSK